MHDHPATLDEYSWPVCVTPRCGRQLWVAEAGRWACRPCEDVTAARIAELPGLFRQLDTTAALMRGARRPGGGSSGSRVPPIPPRLEVLALVGPGGVAARLQAIEDAWRQALGWPTPPTVEHRTTYPVHRGADGTMRLGQPQHGDRVYPHWRTQRPAVSVAKRVTFLANNLPWACERYESVGQDIDDLRRLHGECSAIDSDERKPGRVQIGNCPARYDDDSLCGQPLTATAASHRVRCGACGTRWETLGDWRQLRAAQEAVAAEEQQRQEGVAA
ncbi:hypothetical protein [Streptomyces ortus]|uniref:Uncharacterized protein n=1 Tax=Streptomyces ortus TaxID=2867268 RepID=A0ABT3UWT8_9ACTN|nr:hypothetical protein [Streptomyces ortus]MCX4232031.1 hypothetical protein [Streptomyces ortus]